MTTPLRAAVIGLGVGERHVAAYQAIGAVEVVAVCDLDRDRARSVAARYEVPLAVTDPSRITEDESIDLVSICSYDDAHAEQAIAAFRHGQHVMVEKPAVLTREEAAALLEAQQESGRYLTTNVILRATPRFKRLRDAIRRGDYGEIFYLEGDYLHAILHKITEGWRGRMHTYSVIYGGGIHLIDLMRWLIDDEVEEVCGFGTGILSRDSPYRRPDTTVNLLRFAGGALGKTTTSLGPRHPKFHALKVYGTEATFVNGLAEARIYRGTDPEDVVVDGSPYQGTDKGDLLEGFVTAIREDREPEVGAREVFRVLDICFAAQRSLETGRTIRVDYLL